MRQLPKEQPWQGVRAAPCVVPGRAAADDALEAARARAGVWVGLVAAKAIVGAACECEASTVEDEHGQALVDGGGWVGQAGLQEAKGNQRAVQQVQRPQSLAMVLRDDDAPPLDVAYLLSDSGTQQRTAKEETKTVSMSEMSALMSIPSVSMLGRW